MSIRARGESYQVRVSVPGHGRIERSLPAGATLKDAKELEARLLRGQIDGLLGRTQEPTLADLVARWLLNEAKSLKDYHGVVLRVKVMVPYLDRPVSEAVDAADKMVREARAAGNKPATINRKLAVLRRVLKLAYRQWQVPGVTQDHSQRIGLLPENNQRHFYLTPEVVVAMANEAAKHHPTAGKIVLFAAHTGLRRKELLGLTQANVLGDFLLLGTATKTGKPRMVPLTPEAKVIALAHLPWDCTNQQLRTAFEKARIVVGAPHIRLHDLRHTFASWILQGRGSTVDVRDLLGHASVLTTNRYAHLATQHLTAAANRLPKLTSGSNVGRKKKQAPGA